MRLTKHKVATLNYTLTDHDNNLIDESLDGSFSYLHGVNNIIRGLESALEGKQAGDKLNVVLKPKDAYGEHDPDNLNRVSRTVFPDDVELEIGMQFKTQSSDGAPIYATVAAIEGDDVIVDGNHPMAGKQLHFDVELVDVRDASAEEIQQERVSS